jgi:hypothetical protein
VIFVESRYVLERWKPFDAGWRTIDAAEKAEEREKNDKHTRSRTDPPVIDLLVDSRVGEMEVPRAC